MNVISRWRERRSCYHHDRRNRATWLTEQMINVGMNKLIRCSRCGKAWVI